MPGGIAFGPPRLGIGIIAGPVAGHFTTFPNTENPISEGGRWTTGNDANQSAIQTSGGVASGTQVGNEAPPNYNDSEAYLSGFPPNQRITGVVHRSGTPTGFLEVELLLRWSVGPSLRGVGFGDTHSDGYEINFGCDGQGFTDYFNVARFKGPDAALYVSSDNPADTWSTLIPIQDGDILMAQIVGATITVSLKRSGVEHVLCTVTDTNGAGGGASCLGGQPGIGYFRQTVGTPDTMSNFAWDSITAVAL
jgi:hypothetical protein